MPGASVLRWGLIGPGKIATQFAGALEVVADSCLYAVAGPDRQKAKKFACDHGAVTCHDSPCALLNDPDVDAVYIATPYRYHHQLVRDSLLAGKPVLCDKPLTVNARETQELIELSRRNRVFLMEGLRTRFLPIYEEINQWLVAAKIGTVTSTSSSFGIAFPRKLRDRMLDHDLADGALLDMGVYNLAMSHWVFGIQPARHSIDTRPGVTGIEEYGETTLTYSDGRYSKFTNSLTKQLANDFIIHGSHGHIRIHPTFWKSTRATLVSGCDGNNTGESVTICREFRATGLEYEIEAAARCIRSGLTECPGMSHDDTLDTMKLMDALRRDMGLVNDFEQPVSLLRTGSRR